MEITIECTVHEDGNVVCDSADFGVIAVSQEAPPLPYRPWDAQPDMWSMLPLLLLGYWLWKRRVRESTVE